MAHHSLGDVILYLLPRNTAAHQVIERNPRRVSIPPGKSTKSIVLSFNDQPKNLHQGFLLGNERHCDIRLLSKNKNWRALVTFNPTSGLAVLILEEASDKTDFQVIISGMVFSCDGVTFEILVPQRGPYQPHYARQLSKFLAHMAFKHSGAVKGIYAEPIFPQARVGHEYLEIKRVGSGAFGEVCLFAHNATGQMFAAKRFKNPKNIAEIVGEIQILQRVRHENIVKYVNCIAEPHGSLCLIMEYLPYGNLRDRKNMSMSKIIEILRQCLMGLEFLHARNIMHCDIKPDNIVLKSHSPILVKLVDFGLAIERKYVSQEVGTIIYCAPEMWGGAPYTCAVDIWFLGLTALELLDQFPTQEAQAYLQNQTPQQLGCYITTIQRACQSQQPPIARFLLGMLEKHPQRRWCASHCLQQIKAVKQFLIQPERETRRFERTAPAVVRGRANTWEGVSAAERARSVAATPANNTNKGFWRRLLLSQSKDDTVRQRKRSSSNPPRTNCQRDR